MDDKDLPPYRRIAEDLRTLILKGKLGQGERLRSENELKDQYKTTRVTVRKALALLKAEGLIVSEQGRGVFVRSSPNVQMLTSGANFRERRGTGVSNFNAEAATQGHRPEQRILSVEKVQAPSEIATRLGIPDGEYVLMRRRAFFVNEYPMQLVNGYYPLDLFADTEAAHLRPIKGGVSHLIENPSGPIRLRITQFVEDLQIRMPGPEEAEALKIPPGVPLAQVFRTAHTSAGLVVEVLDSRVPCDRHAFRYVIDVP